MTRVEAWVLYFAVLTEGIQSAAITDLTCKDHRIVQLIYIINVECKIWLIHDLTLCVDYIPSILCSFVCFTVPHQVCTLVLNVHLGTQILIDIDIYMYIYIKVLIRAYT